MLAWSELITDVRKPEVMVMTSLWAGELTDYSDHLANLSSSTQNSNQRAPDAASFFPVGGMPTASSLAWKTSLRKVRTLWHCSRLKGVALYTMIDRGDIIQAIDRCSNIWASLPGAGYSQFEHKADSLIAKLEAGGTVRGDWCMSDPRSYLRSGYLHHRPVMGC